MKGEEIEAQITNDSLAIKIPDIEFVDIIVQITMEQDVKVTNEEISVTE